MKLPFFGKARAPSSPWPLSTPLLQLSRDDVWTAADAVEGTLILGATGSGKSSGPASSIARAMLSAGFGGLVLTAKRDERAQWEQLCRDTGRLADLKVFGRNGDLRFNPFEYELKREGGGGGLTENICGLISVVLDAADRSSSSAGRDGDQFWGRACDQLLRNCVDLLIMARDAVAIPELHRLLVSAPQSIEQMRSEQWRRESFCFECLKAAEKRPKTAVQLHDLGVVADYFMLEFPSLNSKTRSIVISMLTSMTDVLGRGVARYLFCEDTNITPEAALDGRIILIDLPLKEYGDVGLFAATLWKTQFQRAMERRDVSRNGRFVFLFADEAQNFVTPDTDMQFQATCRSARVATVMISQSLANFEVAMGGGPKAKAEATGLLANLCTRIFCANSDSETNEWASTMIGRTLQFFGNGSSGHDNEDWLEIAFGCGRNGAGHTSAGYSESYEFALQPSAFVPLRTGGPRNSYQVDSIVFRGGRTFHATGKTWMPVTFTQKH